MVEIEPESSKKTLEYQSSFSRHKSFLKSLPHEPENEAFRKHRYKSEYAVHKKEIFIWATFIFLSSIAFNSVGFKILLCGNINRLTLPL